MSFPRTARSQPGTSRQEVLTLPTESGTLAGYLLAWTVPIVFCAGLVGLAVSSLLEVAVPRWLILAHGIGCFLAALLAPLLTRPRRQPCHREDAATDHDRAATWNVSPTRRQRGRESAVLSAGSKVSSR
jgi:hypothetical protein